MKIVADQDFGSVARITNLPDATDPQHPATLAQVRAAIKGIAWKDSVRAAAFTNVDISAPGSTIGGVALASNDRVLIGDNTDPSENGIRIFDTSATPMVRAADADDFDSLENATVTVEEGTFAGTTWRQSAVNGTIDTDDVIWEAFGTSAAPASETVAGIAELATQGETDAGTDDERIVTPLKLKTSPYAHMGYGADVGDGSATQYTITHNLGTRDVVVHVFRNSGNYDTVQCDVERTSTNAVRLTFASAPSSNQYRVVVIKA